MAARGVPLIQFDQAIRQARQSTIGSKRELDVANTGFGGIRPHLETKLPVWPVEESRTNHWPNLVERGLRQGID